MADDTLLEHVTKELSAGKTEEQVRHDLSNRSWTTEDINGAIAIVTLRTMPNAAHRAPFTSAPSRKRGGGLVSAIIIIILFLGGASIAYGFYAGKIPFLSQFGASNTAGTPQSTVKTVPWETVPVPTTTSTLPGRRTVAVNAGSSKDASNTAPSTPTAQAPAAVAAPVSVTTTVSPITHVIDAISANPTPVITFSASATSVASGATVTLTWASTNATSCTGTGFSTNSQTSGSVTIVVQGLQIYPITCRNDTRATTAQITVNVQAVTPPASTNTPVPPVVIPPVVVPPIVVPPVVNGQTITVNTLAQLHAAVNSAQGGETILIAPGNYAFFIDQDPHNYSSLVTITAQDRSNPAVIAGINVANWKNVTWSYLNINYSAEQNSVIDMSDNTNYTIDHVNADGQLHRNAHGVLIASSCNNCTVSNSKIHGVGGGFGVQGNAGPVLILNNDIYDIYENGIYGSTGPAGGTEDNLSIINNTIHDFINPGDGSHADGIQIEPIHGGPPDIYNLTIKNNYVYRGVSTMPMQGIFVTPFYNSFFHNVDIENNAVCMDGQFNGLYLDSALGAVVKNNFIVGFNGFPVKIHIYSGDNLVLTGNQTHNLDIYANTNETDADNVVLPQTTTCDQARSWWLSHGGSPLAVAKTAKKSAALALAQAPSGTSSTTNGVSIQLLAAAGTQAPWFTLLWQSMVAEFSNFFRSLASRF